MQPCRACGSKFEPGGCDECAELHHLTFRGGCDQPPVENLPAVRVLDIDVEGLSPPERTYAGSLMRLVAPGGVIRRWQQGRVVRTVWVEGAAA